MEPSPVRPAIAIALLAACAGLLALGFWVLHRPGTGSVAFEPAQEEVRPVTPAADLERADEATRASRRSESEAEPEPEPLARRVLSAESLRSLGKLRVRAVDAQSGAELDRLRVRVANDARLADRDSGPGSSQLVLTLTPGSYELLALSRGYEKFERSGLEVVAGGELEPEPLRLRPASARVEGVAFGDLRPENKLQAELLGEGRSPCAQCAGSGFAEREKAWTRAEPCPACGYAANSSRLPLPSDGRFAFEHLVIGRYALRLLDARGQPLGLGQSFELREGQTLRLDPEAPGLRTVEVEFVDTDGSSLAGEWSARIRGSTPVGELEIVEGSSESADFLCTLLADERYSAHAILAPPAPPERLVGSTSIGVGHFSGRRLGSSGPKGPDDHPRGRNEGLPLPISAPVLEPAAVTAAVGEDGLARFESLPAFDLQLQVSSGLFRADTAIPGGLGTVRVRARLRRIDAAEGATYREWERGQWR